MWKKSIFVFLFMTALSSFFPTEHTGDIVDRVWSNLYWAGPTLATISLFMLFLAAWQEYRSKNLNKS